MLDELPDTMSRPARTTCPPRWGVRATPCARAIGVPAGPRHQPDNREMTQPLLDGKRVRLGCPAVPSTTLRVDDRGLANPNRLIDHAVLLGKLTWQIATYSSQSRVAKPPCPGFRRTLVFRDNHQPTGFAVEAIDHARVGTPRSRTIPQRSMLGRCAEWQTIPPGLATRAALHLQR